MSGSNIMFLPDLRFKYIVLTTCQAQKYKVFLPEIRLKYKVLTWYMVPQTRETFTSYITIHA